LAPFFLTLVRINLLFLTLDAGLGRLRRRVRWVLGKQGRSPAEKKYCKSDD